MSGRILSGAPGATPIAGARRPGRAPRARANPRGICYARSVSEHQRKTLVQRPECRIEHCSCGVYHVSVGAITIRMGQAQLTSLFDSLGVALAPTLDARCDDDDPPVH